MNTNWREIQFVFVMVSGFLIYTILVLIEASLVIFHDGEQMSERVISCLIIAGVLTFYRFNRREFVTMIRDQHVNNFQYSVTMWAWLMFNIGVLYAFTLERLNIPVGKILKLYTGG